jgi:hypothetical protein
MLNRVTGFDLAAILPFPIGYGSVLSLHIALTEDVLEDVFEVMHLVVLVVKLYELGSRRAPGAGDLMVSQPELVAVHSSNRFKKREARKTQRKEQKSEETEEMQKAGKYRTDFIGQDA